MKPEVQKWVDYLSDIYEPAVMLNQITEEELAQYYDAAAKLFRGFAADVRKIKRQQEQIEKNAIKAGG